MGSVVATAVIFLAVVVSPSLLQSGESESTQYLQTGSNPANGWKHSARVDECCCFSSLQVFSVVMASSSHPYGCVIIY